MAENYKHLYEQMKKMVAMYQDELVPGMRKTIEELEQNRVEVVRCKDCKHSIEGGLDYCVCNKSHLLLKDDDFCSYGERRAGE